MSLTSGNVSQRSRWNLIIILGGLMAMQPFALDPYLPAAPYIAKTFLVSDQTMQLTLSALTLGFALGQLITGPLSDSLGRRRPMLVAAVLYVIAAVIVVTAPNITVFFVGRVLQGVSAASIQVVGNAVMRDLYAGTALMKMMSRVFLVQALSWFIGPLGGTLLLGIMDWRGVTVIIGAYGLTILLLASRFLPETLNKDLRQEREGVVALGRRFASVMKDRIYMGVVAVGILNSIGLFGYLSIMPFIYQNHFGLAGSQYGYFFVLNSASGYIGVQVIAKVSQRIQLKWVVVGIFACQIVFGVGLVAAALLEANLFVVQATIMLLVFFIGGSFAPLGTLALTRHGEEAGTAAALNMVLGSIGTTLAAPLFAQLGSSNTLGLGLMEIAVFTLALIGMFTIVNVRKMPNL